MTTTSQDPLVGHTLAGKYVIEQLIREEGLGKVYDASILPQRVPVNIKVLHPHLVEDKESFGRFGREMLATAAVNHPNSVRMLDFGEHRGIFHFIVLERLWARSLAQELATRGALSVTRVCHIAAQVASALTAAHGENIVHRNLSSNNVLLLENAIGGDFVKIRDFGMSRLNDDRGESDDDISGVDTRVGSASYMAPEYIDLGLVDARTDLYALGVLMFEMLTGEVPFTGRVGDVLEAHVRVVPPPPSAKVPCPTWLDALVGALLEKDPLMRPRSAAEVLMALQRGTGSRLDPPELGPDPTDPPSVTPVHPMPDRLGPPRGVGVVRSVVVVGVLVLVVAILASLLGTVGI